MNDSRHRPSLPATTPLAIALLVVVLVLLLAGSRSLRAQDPAAPLPFPPLPERSMWADQGELDWGGLNVHSGGVLHILRLGYVPGRISPLAPGQVEVRLDISHFNQWGQYEQYFADGEFTRYAPRVAVGVVDRLELFASYSMIWHGGGVLDSFLEGFHDLLGITQARRDLYPKDQLHFEALAFSPSPAPGVSLDNSDEGVGFGDLTVGMLLGVLKQRRHSPAVSFMLELKFPVGDSGRGFASPGLAALLAMQVQAPITHWFTLLAAIGPAVHDSGLMLGFETRVFQWFWFVGVQFRVAPVVTITLQFLWQGGIAPQGYGQLEYPTNEWALGVQWAVSPSTRMEFALIENTEYHGNTPDFGLHVSIVHVVP